MINHSHGHATAYIVDDEPDVRNALRKLVQSVGLNGRTFQDGREFLDYYDGASPGCLILDVRLNGMSGLELQQHLNESNSSLPIIFMSGYADVRMAVDAIKAGAMDFVEKPFRAQDMLDRIQAAIQSDSEHRKRLTEQLQIRDRYDALTRREREVLSLVVQGMTTKRVAQTLGISHKTVDIHRSNVMHKMQADSLAELVGFAYRGHLDIKANGRS